MGLRSKQHVFKVTLKSFHFQVKALHKLGAYHIVVSTVHPLSKNTWTTTYTCQHALHGQFTRCERISMLGHVKRCIIKMNGNGRDNLEEVESQPGVSWL